MSKGNSGPTIEFVSVSKAFLCFAVHHASSHLGCLASYAASPTPRPVCKMLGNGRPSGTGIGEKGDTDRGLLPLTDQQFRHRRKLHNGFKVLSSGAPARYPTPTRSPHHRSAPPGAAKTPRSRPHPRPRGTDRGHPRYLARSLRRATTTHTCASPPTWSLTPMSVTAPMPTDRPQTCLIQGHHPHPAVAQVRGDVLHYELSEVL